MKKFIKVVSEILESEAGLSQMNLNEDERVESIVDNRYDLLLKKIELYEDKTDEFYTKLISVLSQYINKIYNRKIECDCRYVFDKDFNCIEQDYNDYNYSVRFNIELCNRKLSEMLFNFICNLLQSNVDIKLDVDTLKQLLNRNPKLFEVSLDLSYLYRMFDYNKLCNILCKNNTLEKSNISAYDTYKILIDTCQINNCDVFAALITPEQFKKNHSVVDEFLKKCNSKIFAEVSNIVVNKFDNNYDRFSIIKERDANNKNNFCERVIKEMLGLSSDKSKYQLIHQLLTDDDISIDYNYFVGDYYGSASLRDVIAHSRNRLIVNDLLSKDENIENYYFHGESCVALYELYAIIGKYDEALNKFDSSYHYSADYTEDYNDDFNRRGYTYAGISYEDSLTRFIKSICKSLKEDKVNYNYQKNIIYNVLNSDKTKYINLDDIVSAIEEVINREDLNVLLENLYQKYKNGQLGFISYTENTKNNSMFDYYIIKLETEEKINEIIESVKGRVKVLTLHNKTNM